MEIPGEQIKKLLKTKLTQDVKNKELLELEVRYQPLGQDIDFYQFRNIVDKLTFSQDKGGLGLSYKQKTRLDIKTNDKVRLSVDGLDNVKLYWLKNGLQYLKPEAYSFIRKKKGDNIDLDNYQFRVSLTNEEEISDEKKSSNVQNINNSATQKNFRLKNTYLITSPDKMFRFDLSSVKMANSNSLKKSNIFSQAINYEIEMEYIGKTGKGIKLDEVYESLLANMNLLLSLIQDNHLLTTKVLEEKVVGQLMEKIGQNNYTTNPVAANPITLQPINLTNQTTSNILKDYAVTYKADGVRHLLYVYNNSNDEEHGAMYLINDNLEVRRTGYLREDWAGSLVEGEYISKINTFLAYDMLWDGEQDLRDLPLDAPLTKKGKGKNQPRLVHLDQFLEDVESGTDFDDDRIMDNKKLVRFEKKKYKYSVKKGDIFERVMDLDNEKGLLDYDIDGYIFTPIKEAYPKKPGKWDKLFKWKPPNQNSIDFLVSLEKNEKNQDIVNPLILGKGKIKQYKTLILHVGGLTQQFNKNNKKWNKKLEPVEFNPYNLEYDEAKQFNRVNIILNQRGRMSFKNNEENRWEEIIDDIIVEFVWDEKKDVGFQWVPIRVRHDKTAKYKRGENMFGNFEDVANNNWRSIVNPVTFQMLTTGQVPPEYLDDEMGKEVPESYYKACQVANYNHKKRLPYQNFHNLIVKMGLISKYSPLGIEGKLSNNSNQLPEMKGLLLDLACGKGGDLSKWKRGQYKKVVSLDIDEECISYAKDYYQTVEPPKPLVVYLQGDSRKLIFPNYQNMMEPNDLKQFQENLPAKFMFDVVSLQFCLHYFFEKEVMIRTLLQNANDTLKVGGHFIGTCFDGQRIYDTLKGTQVLEATLDDEVIWKIEKKYKPFKFEANKPNYGKKISVFTKSIGHTHDEFLVNFTYLDTLCLEYGFEKVEVKGFGDIYDENEVEKKKGNMYEASRMSDEEKEFSFLNNIFVYKKVNNTPDKVFAKLRRLIDKEEKYEKKKDIKEVKVI